MQIMFHVGTTSTYQGPGPFFSNSDGASGATGSGIVQTGVYSRVYRFVVEIQERATNGHIMSVSRFISFPVLFQTGRRATQHIQSTLHNLEYALE